MVVADYDGHIGFGLIQILATQQAHRPNVGVQLSKIFARGPNKELRCVLGPKCGYDFSHVRFLVSF